VVEGVLRHVVKLVVLVGEAQGSVLCLRPEFFNSVESGQTRVT